MEKKSKVTIRDVAKHASVGLGTVSRALNGNSEISPKTKKKIMDSIRELGFVPNRSAQGMRSQKYKSIGFVVGDISNIAFAEIAKGINDCLEEHGYTLVLYNTGDHDIANKVSSFLSRNKMDGIILSLPREDDEIMRGILVNADIPIVTIDRVIEDIPTAVVTNYYDALYKATNYLLSLGHRNVAVMTGTRQIRPTRDSIRGFRDAYEGNGLTYSDESIYEASFTSESAQMVMQRLLPKIRAKEITAIISLNLNMFHGILRSLQANGLEYPADVSLLTLEDSELTQLLKPAVTVIRRPLKEIGRQAVTYLLGYMKDAESTIASGPMLIATEFVIRDSCAPVK